MISGFSVLTASVTGDSGIFSVITSTASVCASGLLVSASGFSLISSGAFVSTSFLFKSSSIAETVVATGIDDGDGSSIGNNRSNKSSKLGSLSSFNGLTVVGCWVVSFSVVGAGSSIGCWVDDDDDDDSGFGGIVDIKIQPSGGVIGDQVSGIGKIGVEFNLLAK